jgi:hypothetical protein
MRRLLHTIEAAAAPAAAATAAAAAAAAAPLLLLPQVKSGGLMGVGQVNRTTLGMIVMPSVAPYTRPFIIQGERSRWWTARARAVVIALFVMVGVFGLQLLSCIGILIYRMVKAGKQKRNAARTMITTTPFEDGIGQYHVGLGQPAEIGHGASSLENQARRHGATGGL